MSYTPGIAISGTPAAGYVPVATSTTGSSWQSVTKLDWVSVRDHGAAGDGTTDDTAAVQAALNMVGTAGSGVVYLPSGTYLLSSTLTVPSNCIIRGDGTTATVLQQNSTTGYGLTTFNLEFLRVEDLMVIGPGQGVGTGHGIYCTGDGTSDDIDTFYLSLRNVMVKQFGHDGVHVDSPVAIDLVNVTAKEVGVDAFYLYGGTSASLVACYGHHATSNAFVLESMHYSSLIGCAADNCVNAYKLDGSEGIALIGCGAEVNSGDGLQITGGSVGITASSLWVDNAGSTSVHVEDGSTGVTLVSPREGTTASTATWFVSVDSGCEATVIAPDSHTASNYAGTVTLLDSSGSASFPGTLGVGTAADPTISVNVAQAADQRSLVVSNSTVGGNVNQPSVDLSSAAAAGLALASRVSGDTTARYLAQVDGSMSWGPGSAGRDVTLARTATGTLTVGGNLDVTGSVGNLGLGGVAPDTYAPISLSQSADQRSVILANTVSGGNQNQPSIDATAAASGGLYFAGRVSGDTTARFLATVGGQLAWGPGTASRDVTLSRGAANRLDLTTADLRIATAGYGLRIKEGINARMGVATLVAGTVTVANTSITASSRIMLTVQSLGTVTTPQPVAVTARTAGTSFTITSASASDTSVVAWQAVEPG